MSDPDTEPNPDQPSCPDPVSHVLPRWIASSFRCSASILLHYIVVVTFTRKQVSAPLCGDIENSGVIY